MKQKIKKLIANPLISGSIILFSGSLLISVLNFLFNLFMLRNLSIANYGTLASLVTLTGYSSILAGSFSPALVRYMGHYFAEEKLGYAKKLFIQSTKLTFLAGIIAFLLIIAFSNQINQFFHINNTFLIILAGIIVFVGFISVVSSSILQAKLLFAFSTGTGFLSTILKILLGVVLVFFGFSVAGAMGAILVSLIFQYIINFIPLNFLFKTKSTTDPLHTRDMFTYGLSSAISLFCVTSFLSNDVLLAKHFFSPTSAGIYAGLSLVGRVIFFFSSPIATVMFPLVVQQYAKKSSYHRTFFLSLLLVLIPSVMFTIIYFIFPNFIILFFSKRREYLVISPLLGLYGVYITVFSLLSVLTNFFLSIKELRVAIPLVMGVILQVILISFYHQSFLQLILISLIVVSLLLGSLLLYYMYLYGQHTKEQKTTSVPHYSSI